MAEPTRQSWRLPAFITLCVVTVLGWAPLVGVVASSLFASYFGCTLNEAGANPCVVGGIDWGEALAFAFVSGWFMLLTWPLILLSLLGWFVLEILFVMRRVQVRRARGDGTNTPQTSI